jgi:anti-sigma factor RsiW
MICRQLTPDIIDHARGVALDSRQAMAVAGHLASCAACAAMFEHQRAMSRALRRLAGEQPVPSADDRKLRTLLSAFDAPRPAASRIRLAVELSLAASVLIVAGLSVASMSWKTDAPARAPQTAATPAANTRDFVVLPGAEALPQFEHGQVIQVDIPSAAGVVRAEVLIGQDGLARAARLVQ